MMRNLRLITVCTGLALVLVSIAFAYQAGCAADLKGGKWGDFHRALQWEDKAMFALILGAMLFAISAPHRGKMRIWIGCAAFAIALPAGYIAGWHFETEGNMKCASR